MTTTTEPRASGDVSQPSTSPGPAAPFQAEGVAAGQSGPAMLSRYYLVPCEHNTGWWEVIDRDTGRVEVSMRGRTEPAKVCRRLNRGAP